MGFPRDRLDLITELYLGATLGWVDISGDVRTSKAGSGGGVTITRGRSSEGGQLDQGRASLVLDNRSGAYSPRNPLSPYYGVLGRNTPIRISVRQFVDDFARTETNSWGTSADGGLWSAFGGGGSVLTTDWTVSGGQARHSVPAANAYRASYYRGLALVDAEVRVTVDMAISDVLGGTIEPANIILRMQQTSTYYLCRVEVSTAEVVSVSIHHSSTGVIAGPTVVSGLTFTGQPLAVAASCVGDRLAVKVWDPAAGGEPRDWQVTATDRQITAAGWVGVRSGVASGNSNTKPVTFTYDDFTVRLPRAHMEVPTWPIRSNQARSDQWVPIEAAGILRRLRQGNPPRRSPLRRAIEASAPSAYWPGEDGRTSTGMGSAVSGHPAMAVTGTAEFVALQDLNMFIYSIPVGTAALIDLKDGGAVSAGVPGDVTTATASGWTVQIWAEIPVTIASNFTVVEWYTLGGTYTTWRVVVTAIDTQLIGVTPSGAQTTLITRGLLGGLAPYSVTVEQVGGNVDVTFGTSTSFAGTVGGVTRIAVNPTGVTATDQIPAGHLAVWAAGVPPYDDWEVTIDSYGETVYAAAKSYGHEAATDRLVRLCAEAGIPLAMPDVDEGDIVRMGFQPTATLADLIQQCVDVDGGILMEMRDGLGLRYRPRASIYNQTPYELPYGRLPSLEPVDDDQQLRNDITVTRTDGSSARAAETSGPLSILDPPDGAGAYSSSVDLPLWSDRQLADHAGWRLHLGTVDEARYPRIPVRLAASAWATDVDGSAALASLDSADLVRLTGLPSWLPAAEADAVVQGYTETLDVKRWDITFHASPGSPWRVLTAADPDVPPADDQRIASDDSTLAAGISTSDTVLQVSSSVREGLWTADPTDYPLLLTIGGEQIEVGAPGEVLNPDPFDIDAGSYTTLNATHAGTTGASYHSSYGVLLVTPSGGTEAQLRTVPVSATVGTSYTAGAWVLVPGGWATGMRMAIQWETSGGALVSVSYGTVSAATALEWMYVSVTATAPATTGQMRPFVAMLGTPAVSNTWYTSAFTVVAAAGVTASPQRLTVSARAVNGVSKAHSAGTAVDVANPATVSL